MSDQHNTLLPRPSDDELTLDYVALKPGVYSHREPLTPYKGKQISNTKKLDIPLGVGNENSVVYIYPQGTIEIIGEVYAWNKLIKPGVYSQFEKLRYLTNEIEVLPRDENTYTSRHASYNKTITVPNPFLSERNEEAEWILELNYVSFEDQITTRDEDKKYPIPILNGELTIYPDGTFKTKNIVVDSVNKELVDPYGYLADHDNYTTIKTYYDTITKDDLNPLNVYKLISRNDDGSITYGAIEANSNIKRQRWMMLPEGIIPVNNGEVTISVDGTFKVSGLVITNKGHPINTTYFNYSELYLKNEQQEYIPNENYIDNNIVYIPVIENITNRETNKQYIGFGYLSNENKTLNYIYHPDNQSIRVNRDENGEIISITFKAMRGWDNFKPATFVDEILSLDDERNLFPSGYLENILDGIEIDKSSYPWIVKGIQEVGGQYRKPIVRLNPNGVIDKYLTIDHTLLFNPTDIERSKQPIRTLGYNTLFNILGHDKDTQGNPINEINGTLFIDERINNDVNTYINDNYIKTKNKINDKLSINKFVPYRSLLNNRVTQLGRTLPDYGSFIITKENDKHYITVKGLVIWKNNDQYYTLTEGKAELDYTWPDIKRNEKTGEYYSLFTIDGYFTDEPIFFSRKHGHNPDNDIQDFDNIDGIKRQENGVFTLVSRNITAYLTTYEKMLIDNYNYSDELVEYDNENVIVNTIPLIPIGREISSEIIEDSLTLEYHAFRHAEITNNLFGSSDIRIKSIRPNTPIDTITKYNRDQEYFSYIDSDIIINSYSNNSKGYIKYENKNSKNIVTKGRIFKGDNKDILYFGEDKKIIDNNKYISLTNVHFDNSSATYLEPEFDVDKYHILTDGPLTINVTEPANNTLFYYRTSEDTKYITGSFYVGNSGHYLIPISLEYKYGYVDIWYDDPFNDKASVKRVRLKKDDIINPVVITEPEEIDNRTEKIKGDGEPRAKLKLYAMDDLNTLLGHTTVNEYGRWSLSNFNTLTQNKRYRIVQEDAWGNITYTHFNVVRRKLKENDIITVQELMGVNNYVYPVNLRNTLNDETVYNLIDSSISFHVDTEQYEITGIVMDETGLCYVEGIYNIGQTPPSYRSNYLGNQLPAGISPQLVHQKENKYRYSRTPYRASKITPLLSDRTIVSMNDNTSLNEKWVIPPTFKVKLKSILDALTNDEFKLRYPNLANTGLANVKNILYNFVNISNLNNIDCFVGRYQNKLVFDSLPVFMQDNIKLYLYQKGDVIKNGVYNGYKQFGMDASTFLSNLNENKPWFYENTDIVGVNDNNTLMCDKDNIILQNSLVNPPPNAISVNVFKPSNNQFKNKQNNLKVNTPQGLSAPITIFNIVNWDYIVDGGSYNNETNIIYYGLNYNYILEDNYSTQNPMKSKVEKHWTEKGFNPSMFVFDNYTSGRVEYDIAGESVTITGRIKIGERYTVNTPQTITNKSQIQFSQICINSLYSHPDYGNVVWNDDDTFSVEGIVYGKITDEECNVLDMENKQYPIPRYKDGIHISNENNTLRSPKPHLGIYSGAGGNTIRFTLTNIHPDLLNNIKLYIVNQAMDDYGIYENESYIDLNENRGKISNLHFCSKVISDKDPRKTNTDATLYATIEWNRNIDTNEIDVKISLPLKCLEVDSDRNSLRDVVDPNIFLGWSDVLDLHGAVSTHLYLVYKDEAGNPVVIDNPYYFVIENTYTMLLKKGHYNEYEQYA